MLLYPNIEISSKVCLLLRLMYFYIFGLVYPALDIASLIELIGKN